MTSLFPPFNRRSSFRKQPYFYEAGRGVNYKSTGGPFPTLDLNFLSGTLDPRITFSRASNATLTDSTGKITYAPNNLATYSEQFDNAAWVKTNATVTANATTAPDGSLTADKMIGTGSNPFMANSVFVAGIKYVYSIYAKAAELNWIRLTSGSAGVNAAWFNVSNGTVGTIVGSGNTATITSVGSGWYRCVFVVTAANSVTGGAVIACTNADNTTSGYTGNGVDGVFIWGAQLEAVTYQTSPSTYVPTTASAYYGPRFDYDPVTLASKGLLIEEQRTNIVTYSEQFDNAAWTKTNTTITANSTTAPDGTTTADLIAETTTNATHVVQPVSGISITSGVTYAASLFVKKGTGATAPNIIQLTFGASVFGSGQYANFDISIGGGTSGTVTSSTGLTASIVNAGNGWWRCTVVATATASATSSGIIIALVQNNSSATRLPSYAGSTTSDVFYWGAQLEAGSFATSYIPTVASSVTRSADIASMTGSNFSSWYNASAGTFWTLFDGPASGTKAIVAADNNTANNNIQLYTSSTDPKFLVADGGVTQADIDAGTVAARTQYKFAGAYAANDFAAAIAGGAAVTDTSGTVPTVDRLRIGSNQAGNYLGGHVAAIKYYNQRLTDAKLQALTI